MDPDPLTEQEVALVLRRAAELDDAVNGTGPGSGLDVAVLEESASHLCRDRGAWVATGGTLGALMTDGAVVLATLVDPLLLLTAPAGMGAAAAGYGIGVKYYRTRVDAVEVALESLLDDLEGRPGISS